LNEEVRQYSEELEMWEDVPKIIVATESYQRAIIGLAP
jgi:hypothetical protein